MALFLNAGHVVKSLENAGLTVQFPALVTPGCTCRLSAAEGCGLAGDVKKAGDFGGTF